MNFGGLNNSVHNRDVACGMAGTEEHQRAVIEETSENHLRIRTWTW